MKNHFNADKLHVVKAPIFFFTDQEDDKYEFSEPSRIQGLVKNYSQFVSFPIYTWQEKSRTVEVSGPSLGTDSCLHVGWENYAKLILCVQVVFFYFHIHWLWFMGSDFLMLLSLSMACFICIFKVLVNCDRYQDFGRWFIAMVMVMNNEILFSLDDNYINIYLSSGVERKLDMVPCHLVSV